MFKVLALGPPLTQSLQCTLVHAFASCPFVRPTQWGETAGYDLECRLNSYGLVHFQESPSGDSALETHFPGDLGWSETHGWDADDGKGALNFFSAASFF